MRTFTPLACLCALAFLLSTPALRAQSAARTEWMTGYRRMEAADSAHERKRGEEALRLYREALATFERVRRKFPAWNAALLNYRITYCKERIDTLARTLGAKTDTLEQDTLQKITKEQHGTIAKLDEERKALQSRIEILTESLERARGEAAQRSSLENSLQAAHKQNDELRESLRLTELKLRASEREVTRLKEQEKLADELRHIHAQLTLTKAQLEKSQETLEKIRRENDALNRKLRQETLQTEQLTRERNDRDIALKMVRELSLERKKANEQLRAQLRTLEARAEDLHAQNKKLEEKARTAGEQAEKALRADSEARERQAEAAENERHRQTAEMKELRALLGKLSDEADRKTAPDARKHLELLAAQLEQKDRELALLARRIAAFFNDREQLIAREEQLEQLQSRLRDTDLEREQHRAAALTSRENYQALKGETARLRTRLAESEQKCLTLTDEVTRYRSMRTALGLADKDTAKDADAARELDRKLKQTLRDEQTLRTQLNAQTDILRKLEDEAGKLKKHALALKTENDALKHDLTLNQDRAGAAEGMAKALVQSEDELKQRTEQLRTAEQQLEIERTRNREAEVKFRTIQKQLDDTRAGNNRAAARQTEELRGKLQQAETRIKALEGVLAESTAVISSQKAFDAAAKAAEAQLDAKARELDAVKKINDALRRQNDLLKTRHDDKTRRLADLGKKLDDAVKKADELELRHLREAAQFKEFAEKAHRKELAAEEKLHGLSDSAKATAETLRKQSAEETEKIKKQADAENEQLRIRTAEETAKIKKQADAENEQLRIRTAEETAKIKKQAENAVQASLDVVKRVNREKEDAENARKSAEEKSEKLSGELVRLSTELAELKDRRNADLAELDALREQLKTRLTHGQPETDSFSPAAEQKRRRREREAVVRGYVEQGLDAERLGNIEAARWNYTKALDIDAANKTALQRMGQLAYRDGDDANAVKFLKQAFYKDPDDTKTLFALGYAYARLEQPDWAVATMGRAVSLNPDNAAMARVYGATLMQLGWKNAAEREFRRALRLDPKEKDAAFNLAVLLAANAAEQAGGLTAEHVRKLRSEARKAIAKENKNAVQTAATILNWLEFYVRKHDARSQEARTWYNTAVTLGAEPDPALDKALPEPAKTPAKPATPTPAAP